MNTATLLATLRNTRFIVDGGPEITIPRWVVDLASFRRWADSDEFPEEGSISYLQGEVWVDMSREQIFTHNQIKGQYTAVLTTLMQKEQLGLFFPDGLLLTNVTADFAVKPDDTFVSSQSLRAGKVKLVEGKEEGFVELEGTPDMVLEVVSKSSVHKDEVVLLQAYWEAGIPEYWLVDARREPLRFDIFHHTAKWYKATRKQSGWLKSSVIGKSFQLTQKDGLVGFPEFTLAVR